MILEALRIRDERAAATVVRTRGSSPRPAGARVLVSSDGETHGSVSRLHAPIGLDIAAVTPQEIAVAVTGEIVAVRRDSS